MNSYLSHYGIPHMKWHQRRFQDEQGRLTPAGKERYKKTNSDSTKKENESKEEVKNTKKQKAESSTWKSKDAAYLTDEELNRRNSRLQRERQYREMTKSKKRKAVEWIAKTAGVIFVASAVGVAKGRMAGHYKDMFDSYGPKASDFISRRNEKWVL